MSKSKQVIQSQPQNDHTVKSKTISGFSTKVAVLRQVAGRYSWLFWLLAVSFVFLLANYKLVLGWAVGIWDANGAYYPYQVLVADHARAGRLLHWDPWSNGGLPAGADPQFGAFSPINLLLGLLNGGTSTGFIIYWLGSWWLGGAGMMLLARHLKAPDWGGAIVATGFLFCGAYITHSEHTSLITAYSFLPLVIWRLDVAICSRRVMPAIEAGALWGLSALSGYPAIIILTGLFAGLWIIGRWLCSEKIASVTTPVTTDDEVSHGLLLARPMRFRLVLITSTAMLLTGVTILAPTYFAYFYEGAGTHTRVGELNRQYAISNDELAPGAISTITSADLPMVKAISRAGNDPGLWPNTDVSMCSIYAGAITLLALLALLNKPKNPWRWWVCGIGLFNLACALGSWLPFRGWLYDWIYPTRFFRHSAIFRVYFIFALAVLAIFAVSDLARSLTKPKDRIWLRFLYAAIVTAVIAFFSFNYVLNSSLTASLQISARRLVFAYCHLVFVWVGMCVVAIFGWWSPPPLKHRWTPLLLALIFAGDAMMTTTTSMAIMADPQDWSIKRWKAMDQAHSASIDLTDHGLLREEESYYEDAGRRLGPLNDQMITKRPKLSTYATAFNHYHVGISNHPLMKQMALGADRIWFSTESASVAANEGNFVAYASRVESLNGFPIVIHSQSQMLQLTEKDVLNPATKDAEKDQISRLPAAEKARVRLLSYLPDELSFEVECPTAGWLMVSDRWARSWRAEINNQPVTVYGGNFIYRAIRAPAGKNTIKFTYRPTGVWWLIIISWGTLAAIAFLSIYRTRLLRFSLANKVRLRTGDQCKDFNSE